MSLVQRGGGRGWSGSAILSGSSKGLEKGNTQLFGVLFVLAFRGHNVCVPGSHGRNVAAKREVNRSPGG